MTTWRAYGWNMNVVLCLETPRGSAEIETHYRTDQVEVTLSFAEGPPRVRRFSALDDAKVWAESQLV